MRTFYIRYSNVPFEYLKFIVYLHVCSGYLTLMFVMYRRSLGWSIHWDKRWFMSFLLNYVSQVAGGIFISLQNLLHPLALTESVNQHKFLHINKKIEFLKKYPWLYFVSLCSYGRIKLDMKKWIISTLCDLILSLG